jgi:hypothetical protein
MFEQLAKNEDLVVKTTLNEHTETLSAVDCGFESRSGQTKDCKIGICCFSDKHATLRRKSNQNKNPTQRVGIKQSEPCHHFIEN